MEIQRSQHGEIAVLTVEGRVDATTCEALQDVVLKTIDEGQRKLLLDLGGVNYVSSAGLRVFLLAAKRLAADSGAVAFCALTKDVRKLFNIMGLTARVALFETREDALANFPSPASVN
ncbi:anti-anti-sigma factor [Isosphaera pallida ATCC 43644]|uniref:Anti-sigma factor antagonist n=1 Tax=Isosphaera pallida (strain ATCC 43644 / DSM 9630 / IS1B) TaxID=575540 RepID=E8R177_ISOPI|nr:STAS domain-containing protein [Isosphaera pallida]ADV61283.1 anti-anti-sigma factor [Isosphaera pallida ATCC 43644]